jgi:hypothetical protein
MRVDRRLHAGALPCALAVQPLPRSSGWRCSPAALCQQRPRCAPLVKAVDLADVSMGPMLPGLLTATTALSNALWRRASRQSFVQEVCRAFNCGSQEELQVGTLRPGKARRGSGEAKEKAKTACMLCSVWAAVRVMAACVTQQAAKQLWTAHYGPQPQQHNPLNPRTLTAPMWHPA